jgi:hypothetical protein
MSGSAAQPVDYGPQPIRCRWLSEEDEKSAPSAEVVRLVVDDSRWWNVHKINETCQRPFFRQVVECIASACNQTNDPTTIIHKKLIVGPAGSITTRLRRVPTASIAGLDECVGLVKQCCGSLEFGCSEHEFLTGSDAAMENEATPFQSVVHLNSTGTPIRSDTVAKLYPVGEEAHTLLGWRICQETRSVPPELASARCIETQIGSVLVFVCYDARLVDGRDIETFPIQDEVTLQVREHFHQAASQSAPRYVLLATHHQKQQIHPKYYGRNSEPGQRS